MSSDFPRRAIPDRFLVTIPEKADPHVRELYRLMREHRMSPIELAEQSGVSRKSIDFWRRKGSPSVANLEACFNVLGYTTMPTPMRSVALPALSEAQKREQAERCACKGTDEMCPCQNVPDRVTLRGINLKPWEKLDT